MSCSPNLPLLLRSTSEAFVIEMPWKLRKLKKSSKGLLNSSVYQMLYETTNRFRIYHVTAILSHTSCDSPVSPGICLYNEVHGPNTACIGKSSKIASMHQSGYYICAWSSSYVCKLVVNYSFG